jgi:molybdenum cofactor synthesis domain-containing protein
LIKICDSGDADVILTTGGTGLGPRDVTPEATAAAATRIVPGLGERMREAGGRGFARAYLSRAIAGVRASTLIVNLPGSPKGAVESLDAVADLLPHAVEVLRGARHD